MADFKPTRDEIAQAIGAAVLRPVNQDKPYYPLNSFLFPHNVSERDHRQAAVKHFVEERQHKGEDLRAIALELFNTRLKFFGDWEPYSPGYRDDLEAGQEVLAQVDRDLYNYHQDLDDYYYSGRPNYRDSSI